MHRSAFAALAAAGMLFAAAPSRAQYTLFDSKEPKLPCTFEYPSEWKLTPLIHDEWKSAEYAIFGPTNAAGSFRASIGITIRAKSTFPYAVPEDYLDSIVARAGRMRDARTVIVRSKLANWGQTIQYIEQSFALPLPPDAAQPVPTVVRERQIVVFNGDRAFLFTYTADAADFEKYLPQFQHFMETFFFK